MNTQSTTIIKDENDPAFVAQVEERIKRARDVKNSVPIDDFFQMCELRRSNPNLKIEYAGVSS